MFRNIFNLFIKSIQNKNIEWCSVCLSVCLFMCLSVCLLYVPWSSSQDVVFVLRHGVWWHPVELQSSDGDYLVFGQVKELPKQIRQTSVQCFVRQCFGIEVFLTAELNSWKTKPLILWHFFNRKRNTVLGDECHLIKHPLQTVTLCSNDN